MNQVLFPNNLYEACTQNFQKLNLLFTKRREIKAHASPRLNNNETVHISLDGSTYPR